MEGFKEDTKLEELIVLRDTEPKKFTLISKAQRANLADYEIVKAEAALPANKRPQRRRYFSNAEKAKFISDNGSNVYLALPW